jgi:hypothetical protein
MGRTFNPFGAIKALDKKLLHFFRAAGDADEFANAFSNCFFPSAKRTEGRPQEKQQYKKSVPCIPTSSSLILFAIPVPVVCNSKCK